MGKPIRIAAAPAMLLLAAGAWASVPTPSTPSTPPTPPRPAQVAQGVWFIGGGLPAKREPDGNSVVFEAPAGLVVIDTGRHEWHRAAILKLAHERRQAIVAILNSHWHLDHVSGNPALRAAFPDLRVYASGAIDSALAGFLASSAREYSRYLDDPRYPEELRADLRADLVTIKNGAALKPDEVIRASRTMRLAGRPFEVHLARNAATSGDVWLYDEMSGIAVLGDLLTLPAPFLETACPEGWKEALAQIVGSPFRLAIPGHGRPLSASQVARYRSAFGAFVSCADSQRPKEECGAEWARHVRPLLGPHDEEAQRARAMTSDYVEMLRANGGRSKYCEAQRAA